MSSAAVQPILALLSHVPGGNPTQYMIEKVFAHHDLDWRYLTVEVHPDALGDAIRGMKAMGFSGGQLGIYHKEAAVSLMDRTTDTAAMVGAVNVIFREDDELVGDNIEARGLLTSLERTAEIKERRVVILGAGRGARAVGVELAAAGIDELTIVNRTEEHAKELAELLRDKFDLPTNVVVWDGNYAVPAEADLLVHATPVGRNEPDAQVPIDLESLREGLLVADMTADPPKTWLLREAAERKCETLDGLTMYIDQVAYALNKWTDIEPNLGVMREAIEEFLEV